MDQSLGDSNSRPGSSNNSESGELQDGVMRGFHGYSKGMAGEKRHRYSVQDLARKTGSANKQQRMSA